MRLADIKNEIIDLVLHIVLSVVFYVLFLYITRTIGSEEKEVIAQVLKK